ncbi:hypothetical protein BDZ97DRAFT_1796475 [Flammula alnicola]|nr:hypothetical protein BDZ97DRAFT_1796475 [Flammula alnicola]
MRCRTFLSIEYKESFRSCIYIHPTCTLNPHQRRRSFANLHCYMVERLLFTFSDIERCFDARSQ